MGCTIKSRELKVKTFIITLIMLTSIHTFLGPRDVKETLQNKVSTP